MEVVGSLMEDGHSGENVLSKTWPNSNQILCHFCFVNYAVGAVRHNVQNSCVCGKDRKKEDVMASSWFGLLLFLSCIPSPSTVPEFANSNN